MCGVRKNWGYLREGQGGREGRIDREATKTEVRKTGRQERQRGKEDRRDKEAGRRGSREKRKTEEARKIVQTRKAGVFTFTPSISHKVIFP